MNNCYNCKYRQTYLTKAFQWCGKQQAWIRSPRKECPEFKIKLWSRIFGDQSPFVRTEKLVGGCEE